MTDVPKPPRDLLQRAQGAPRVQALETEIRSQGAPNFPSEIDPNVSNQFPVAAAWEWHYGVSVRHIGKLITWLQTNEAQINGRIATALGATPRLITYRGTFISATSERGCYQCKTVWSYSGTDPISQWETLLANATVDNDFKFLRGYWAADPGATESLVALLQLYTFPDDFVDPDHEAAQLAVIDATLNSPQP